MNLALLGRETELALAELTSVTSDVQSINPLVASFMDDTDIGSRLGSTVKTARLVRQTKRSSDVFEALQQLLYELLLNRYVMAKNVGISCVGLPLSVRRYQRLLLELKKSLRAQKRPLRLIFPDQATTLNSAQTTHNNLLGKGVELLCTGTEQELMVAEVTWVQDIAGYTRRDRGRPCRSMRLGMVPPKLAQTLVNLVQPSPNTTIADPFCGPGTILQEALLLGRRAIGSDNNEQAVACAQSNLAWIKQELAPSSLYQVQLCDALSWQPPAGPYCIVTEGYLGPVSMPHHKPANFSATYTSLQRLYLAFLTHLQSLSHCPQRLIICLPSWHFADGTVELLTVDQITKIGYTIDRFAPHNQDSLTYRRAEQTVGRRIMSLTLS